MTYASESFVTSDDIADALVAFAAAIAKNGTSEAVSLPVLDEDGQPALVHMVIGPASEIISIPADSENSVGLVVGSALEELRSRTAYAEVLGQGPGTKTGDAPGVALPLDENLPDVDSLAD